MTASRSNEVWNTSLGRQPPEGAVGVGAFAPRLRSGPEWFRISNRDRIRTRTRADNDSSRNRRQPLFGPSLSKGKVMQDRKVTPDMVPVIKLARDLDYNYARIAAYFQINQGRIADVVKGRKFPEIAAAPTLPADFPTA
jgi:hypothetical protein